MPEVSHYKIVFPLDDTWMETFEGFVGEVEQSGLLPAEVGLKVRLVLEELATNADKYVRVGSVSFALELAANAVHAVYEDEGASFNPMDHLPDHPHNPDIDEWPLGRLGCLLIAEMTENQHHSYQQGRNSFAFSIPFGS